MAYDAIVIGAGPAGSSVAAQLAGAGHSVLLLEKQRLPEHKLCGEFLSVEVTAMFERLGVLSAIRAAGAVPIGRALVSAGSGAAFCAPLPGQALALSRYVLDHLLFEHARERGVDARCGVPVRDVSGALGRGFEVATDAQVFQARLVVGAYGKRSRLDRKLDRPFLSERSSRVGIKAHYEGAVPEGMVELHAFSGGYCGLLPIEHGRVNACLIADARLLKEAGGRPEALLDRVLAANLRLASRMASLRRCTAFEAVSQITFSSKGVFAGDVCMVGDAAAMIAPLCGDGMAMALRSAEILAPLAAGHLRGDLGAAEFRHRYEVAWRQAFHMRLRLGRWLHAAYHRPILAGAGVQACRMVPALASALIRLTRG